MQYLSKRDAKNLLKPYGINYEGVFARVKDKIYLVSDGIKKINIEEFRTISAGLYVGKLENQGFRLTIDGAQLFKPKKNVLEVDNLDWLEGKDIESDKKFLGFAAVRYKDDFLGSGLYKQGKILNFVPKVRRILPQ